MFSTSKVLLEDSDIWKTYSHLKESLPGTVSANKEEFFRKLSLSLPLDEQVEIQSCDGSRFDLVWGGTHGLMVSLTESDALSASTNKKFEYFPDCGDDACFHFILRQRGGVNK